MHDTGAPAGSNPDPERAHGATGNVPAGSAGAWKRVLTTLNVAQALFVMAEWMELLGEDGGTTLAIARVAAIACKAVAVMLLRGKHRN